MIEKDEDSLICDFAEYYHIYNYREFPVRYIATLAKGLREDSRTKMAFSEFKVSLDTLIKASIADSCAFLAWAQTESAHNGGEKPPSLVARLCGKDTESQSDIVAFNSPEEFERARAELIGG